MKRKSPRKRIEVILEELDRIIDHGMDVPLSKAEGQKIKAALHAMAERLTGKRSTEKTAAVLPKPTVPAPVAKEQATDQSAATGHGRNNRCIRRG
ncbi:MAG TPA: hypothetical protein VHZ55_33895 [Bryobacteraceae bacterium]|jgi:hypothetical protein|nr:hypothetical protein [Bryobacteraceae bacterium]